MTTQQAMKEAFSLPHLQLSKKTGIPIMTIAGLKFRYKRNQLSLEKQKEFLKKAGYIIKTDMQWKRQAE